MAAKTEPLKLRVDGMDCGSCALKIETALSRLPGTEDISVNHTAGSVTLKLDERQTTRRNIEDTIRSLGYVPHAKDDGASAAIGDEAADLPWWRARNARFAAATGVLLALAFAIAFFVPAIGEWAFAIAAVVGLAPIGSRAFSGARHGTPFSIETLMTVAALGALVIGESAEALVVIFLFSVGELLESFAAQRARAGIKSLIDLIPRRARVERDGSVVEISASDLEIGDIAIVRPGDRIPSDGEVIDGVSEVDESPVTGESVPVLKEEGAAVFAGSVNANALLRVRITRTARDNTIARIVHLVEEAQGAKAPTARFIDRFSRYYTPAAMVVSALIMVIPPLLVGAEWSTWIYRGLAVLLIACPCGLVISTPAAIASGLAAGARRGLLIKGGAALEELGRVKTIAFDKTGTLTEGRPKVTDIVAISGDDADLLARAAAVEAGSSHPLGSAITAAAEQKSLDIPRVFGGSQAIPGKAVTARLKEGFVSVGSPRYAAEQIAIPVDIAQRIKSLEDEGKTVVVVLAAKALLGFIALRDEPRADAVSGIASLSALGLRSVMLTGDNARTAAAIAGTLGITAKSELMPDAKLDEIGNLRKAGGVAMVGDGINDAPALAAASVGIAMGGGTDVALETADVALLKNRVSGVAETIALSRSTMGNIWQNIAIALGLKAIFLVTTLTGTTTLWMAILADTGATVLVTANALRLLRFSSNQAVPSGAAIAPAEIGVGQRGTLQSTDDRVTSSEANKGEAA